MNAYRKTVNQPLTHEPPGGLFYEALETRACVATPMRRAMSATIRAAVRPSHSAGLTPLGQ